MLEKRTGTTNWCLCWYLNKKEAAHYYKCWCWITNQQNSTQLLVILVKNGLNYNKLFLFCFWIKFMFMLIDMQKGISTESCWYFYRLIKKMTVEYPVSRMFISLIIFINVVIRRCTHFLNYNVIFWQIPVLLDFLCILGILQVVQISDVI